MKKCVACQNTVKDTARFCSKCGGKNFEPIIEMPEPPAAPQPVEMPEPPAAPAPQPMPAAEPPKVKKGKVSPSADPTLPGNITAPAGKKGGKKVGIIILVVVLALIVLGVALFLILSKRDKRVEGGKKGDAAISMQENAGGGLGSSPIVFKHIGDVDDVDFSAYNNIVYKDDAGHYVLYDPFGNDTLNETFTYYNIVQKAKGITIVRTTDAAPGNAGLVNINTGKVYVPYGAAMIDQLNERFFSVYYATAKTDSVDDAVLSYDADSDYYSSVAVEGRELYEGYFQIYDIAAEDFVPGIKMEDPGDSARGVGEYFAIYSDKDRKYTIYNTSYEPVKGFPDTSESGVYDYNFPSEYNIFKVGDNTCAVYDKDAKFLFDTNDMNISKVYAGEYYSSYNSDAKEYTLYRKDGTKLFDQTSRYSFTLIGSAFEFSRDVMGQTKSGLVDLEGNVILPADANFITENKPATGFTYASYGDGKYSILFPDGYVLNVDNYADDGCYYEKVADGEYKIFIFADEEYRTEKYASVSSLSKFLLKVRDAEGRNGVLDTFSGQMVLPCEYQRIDRAYENDCIYAKNADDQWEVYATHENDYAAAEKVKRTVLTALDDAFKKEGISATVDLQTGEVALDNDVLFALDKADLSDKGKDSLQKFMRAYTAVVLDEKYEGYIDSILIEGHTDTDGTREHNLELSQNRADNVMAYCLSPECGDSTDFADMFSAVGIADDRPVMNEDGSVNMVASRRVSFTLLIMTQEIAQEESAD